jgi:hypothetical protein
MSKKTTDKQRTNREPGPKTTGGKARSLANLKPFKPGRSGNPSGRPKSITLSEALRHELAKAHPESKDGETYAEKIAGVLCKAAAEGNVNAAKEIADRTEGKPRQAIDVDMSVMDWRAVAKAQGINESDVIAEARRIIAEFGSAEPLDARSPASGH